MRRGNRSKRKIWTTDDGRLRSKQDYLATEEPLAIELRAGRKGKTVAITMRTPGNDYELAAGFLYSEGVIAHKHEIKQMIFCVDGDRQQQYNHLAIHLRQDELPELPQLDRHFFTNSACGVCGTTMLEELSARSLPPLDSCRPVSAQVLAGLPATLEAAQTLFASTGGLHAAALFEADGRLVALREDVGRHNALDKLIGWALLNRQLPLSNRLIMVSGRAGYELLYKCRIAGSPLFCAISAPSSLAVELAAEFGVTLVGFLRGERFNVYTHPDRIDVASERAIGARIEHPELDNRFVMR